MKIERSDIPDVLILSPQIFGDDRGYFVETFREDILEEFLGYKINFIQDNESKSLKGVLRGLHYQIGDSAQTKLVRVVQGEVLDVAVDLRKDSPTFGEYVSILLNDENKKQLLVPKGFAHGFVVLSEKAIFSYKVDNSYNPENERGIMFDDKYLNIDWMLEKQKLKLSQRDKNLSNFENAIFF